MRALLSALALFLCACPSGLPPVTTCESPGVQRRAACPAEVRDWTRVQGGGSSEARAISNANGAVEYAVIEPGTCVYTDACGTAWHIQGCYLADGYVCP